MLIMRTIHFKSLVLTLLIALTLPMSIAAQFVRFTINIPPSFEITDRGSAPAVLEPVQVDRRLIQKPGVRWIEIRTNENIDLIIEMKYSRSVRGTLNRTYFLNNGTTNFGSANEILSNRMHFKMYHKDLLINEIPSSPKFISSWVGIMAGTSGTLTIIYP